MSAPLYQLRVSRVGKYVAQALEDNSLILFSEPVPQDIADYCVVHHPGELTQTLMPGQIFTLHQTAYEITAVGEVATVNLKQLGHITLIFDGNTQAALPGTIHLRGAAPASINADDIMTICASHFS